jgi:hypothetical protein
MTTKATNASSNTTYESINGKLSTLIALNVVALIFGIILISLTWVSFNRLGTDVSTIISERTEDVENRVERINIEPQLVSIEERINLGEEFEEFEQDWLSLRRDLVVYYEENREQIALTEEEFENRLDTIEQNLRTDTAQGLQQLEDFIDELERDVETDDDPRD